MPIKPYVVQKRMMELGRVRLGEKTASGAPKKLDRFRFTSASKSLLDAVAAKYGGTVKPWANAPDEGYYEVVTEATELDIVFPPIYADDTGEPTVPFSQWLEMWSGGGCQRRCDGETEAISGQPCLCQASINDGGERVCKPTTRISFMLPDIPGLGVWRVESKGWNAAAETPGSVSVLVRAATEGRFIPAVLRLEHRTSKSNGRTNKFVVPVIDVAGATMNELAGGSLPLAINGPTPSPPRPALPAAAPEPAPDRFQNDDEAPHGAPPPLPDEIAEPDALSVDAFKQLCNDAFLSPQKVSAVGKRLFPGSTRDSLTDEQRAQLWAELEREKEPTPA